MSASDLSAQLESLKRIHHSEFRCDLCNKLSRTQDQFRNHYRDTHKEALAGLNEEQQEQFYVEKLQQCRTAKQRVIDDSSAQPRENGGRSDQNIRNSRAARGQGSVGLTKQVKALRIQSADTRDDHGTTTEGAPAQESPRSIQLTQQSTTQESNTRGKNKESRRQTQRGNVASSNTGGRRAKPPVVDPEFDRNLPPEQSRSTHRLYNPNEHHRGPGLGKRAEDQSQRLENPMLQPAPAIVTPQTKQTRTQGQTGGARARKDAGRVSGAQRADRMDISTGPEHGGSRVLIPREAAKTMILKNFTHSTVNATNLQAGEDAPIADDDPRLKMVRQPETRPITHAQLLSEVKGIYAGLLMVEAKCQEVDQKQAEQAQARESEGQKPPRLSNEQWQALIALHRTLLHEHHDFFLASQHPSSTPSLRKLAEKYAMPARMWRHGIHNFLELLRSRLPESLEHMLTFIYLAYSIMALLYETIPAFEETWIECLGDLGRCRMAIEDQDIQDREVWSNVAKGWYLKGVDRRPSVGRLYHHLAILARPSSLEQLFYYCKSLTVSNPSSQAKESIFSLFGVSATGTLNSVIGSPLDTAIIKIHEICFTRVNFDSLDTHLDNYLSLLDRHLSEPHENWTAHGALTAICNIAAIFEYNGKDSKLRKLWQDHRTGNSKDLPGSPTRAESGNDTENRQIMPEITTEVEGLLPPFTPQSNTEQVGSSSALTADHNVGTQLTPTMDSGCDDDAWHHVQAAARMGFKILDLVLERTGDDKVLSHVLIWLIFLNHLKSVPPALQQIELDFPWQNLAAFLNSLLHNASENPLVEAVEYDFEGKEFPKGSGRPLSEDWKLRGYEWTRNYYPPNYMEESKVPEEERSIEKPSMITIRKHRILWLGHKLDGWITYDSGIRHFAVDSALVQRIEETRIRATQPKGQFQSDLDHPMSDEEMDVDAPPPEDDYSMDGFEDLEQSEELQQLRELKLKQQALQEERNRMQAEANDVDISEVMVLGATRRVTARDALRSTYTILVVDTNHLLGHLDVFKLALAKREWSIVIPNTVMTELMGLNNDRGTVGQSARDAITAIQEAIAAKVDLKIITAKGNNITQIGFYKERLDEYTDDDKVMDDVIIDICQQQGKLRAEMMQANGEDLGLAQPSVLVTDDVNMRVKATVNKVAAISSAALKGILQPQATNPSSRTKRKSTNTPATPVSTIRQAFPHLSQSEINQALGKNQGDLEATLYSLTQAHGSAAKTGSNLKRTKRDILYPGTS